MVSFPQPNTAAPEIVPVDRSPFTLRGATRAWPSLHHDLRGVLILLVLTGLVAADGIQGGRWVYRIDVISYFIPTYEMLGDQLRAGRLPGWLPGQFAGAPLASDPQSGWLYLPVMALFTALPGIAAFKSLIVFHLLLGGCGAYAFARSLGMRSSAALLAASAYEFTAIYPQARCCPTFTPVAAWLPLAFLGIERGTRGDDRLTRITWLAITGFSLSQMIAAWIGQGSYYATLALGGYLVYRTVFSPTSPHSWRTRLTTCFGAGLVAFGSAALLAGGGIWLRFEMVNATTLAGGAYHGVAAAAAAKGRTWDLPEATGNLLSASARLGRFYLGGGIALLALLAPVLVRRRLAVPYFAIYAAVAFILILDETPLHRALYLLPKFQSLHEHVPSRSLVLIGLGTAMLAGATVETLARGQISRWLAPMAVLLLPIVVVGRSWMEAPLREVEAITLVAIGVSGILVVIAIFGSRRVPPGAIVAALIAIVLLDATGWSAINRSLFGHSIYGEFSDADAERFATATDDTGGAAGFLRAQRDAPGAQPFRYFGYDQEMIRKNGKLDGGYYVLFGYDPMVEALLIHQRGTALGLEDLQGYSPIQNARYAEFVAAMNGRTQNYHQANVLALGIQSPLLNLLNPRFIVVPNAVPPGRPDLFHLSQRHRTVYADARVRVLENAAAFPRAWIVHDTRAVDRPTALALLTSDTIDFARTAIVEAPPPALSAPPSGAVESAVVTDREPDRLRLTVTAAAPGLVVLSEVYDKGWRAYLDGERVPVVVADYVLRAVAVPAGTHTVELRYEPASLELGTALSVVSLSGFGALLSITGWRWEVRRRRLTA